MKTKYRVKVRAILTPLSSASKHRVRLWRWHCQACESWSDWWWETQQGAHDAGTDHAATCETLHFANWAAACPSCRRYGRVAPACPVCLGRGHIVEREVLE